MREIMLMYTLLKKKKHTHTLSPHSYNFDRAYNSLIFLLNNVSLNAVHIRLLCNKSYTNTYDGLT